MWQSLVSHLLNILLEAMSLATACLFTDGCTTPHKLYTLHTLHTPRFHFGTTAGDDGVYLLDYGAGNVRSIVNAVEAVGGTLHTIQSAEDFKLVPNPNSNAAHH